MTKPPGAGPAGPGGPSGYGGEPPWSGAVPGRPGGGTAVLPPPPPGPGVRTPFVAPPTDGNRRRLATGLITSAVVLVLVCAGGVVGIGALIEGSVAARRTGATKAVTAFLTDIQHDNYTRAYREQCADLKRQVSFGEFVDDFSRSPLISFQLGDPQIDTDATIVPVDLTFAGGAQDHERIAVVVESDGTSRVCGSA